MGLRLLAVVVLVALVVFFVKRWLEKPRKSSPHESTAAPQRMAKCPVCGTYLPEADAVKVGAGFFCSEAHAQQFETPGE